jgi:hypothetical protein
MARPYHRRNQDESETTQPEQAQPNDPVVESVVQRQAQQIDVPESPTPPTQEPESAQTGTSAETDSPAPAAVPASVPLSAAELTELRRLEASCRSVSGPYPDVVEMKTLSELRKRA